MGGMWTSVSRRDVDGLRSARACRVDVAINAVVYAHVAVDGARPVDAAVVDTDMGMERTR